jgi:hypothetical protein
MTRQKKNLPGAYTWQDQRGLGFVRSTFGKVQRRELRSCLTGPQRRLWISKGKEHVEQGGAGNVFLKFRKLHK